MVQFSISFENRRTISINLHAALVALYCCLAVFFWISNMKPYIFRMALVLLIVSTIFEVILRGDKLSHKSAVMNIGILVMCFYFLLNGLGQTFLFSNSIGLSAYPPNADFIALSGMDQTANLFGQIFAIPEVLACVAFAAFGGILINVGDASDNVTLYMVGTLIATTLPMFILLGILVGWIPPAEYFYQLGGSAAHLLEFSAVLGVVVLILSVVFMFDDIIGSVTFGE